MIGSIALITTTLTTLRSISHELTCLDTLETNSEKITTLFWVVPTTLSIFRNPICPCAPLPCNCPSLALKLCEFYFLKSHMFFGAGSLADDGASPFDLCWKDYLFTLSFCCPSSSHVILSFMLRNSSLCLKFSSSTFFTWIISLSISMSPICTQPYPVFLTNEKTLTQISSTYWSYQQPSPKHNRIVEWNWDYTHAHSYITI